jgi:glycosyltransferase involved in cell wall biosynthesis
MKPKIVYVGYDPSIKGGIQNVSDLIKKYFPELIFHPSIKDSNRKFAYIMSSVIAYFRYVHRMSKTRPQIAHILIASPFDQIRNLPYIIISRIATIKILLQFRYNIGPEFKKMPPFLGTIVKRIFGMADLFVFSSERLQKDFHEKVKFHKSICIPNPVPSEYLKGKTVPLEEREQNVIYLGRFAREKGIYDLLEAARMHSEIDNNVRYHFYGDGIYPKRYPVNCEFHKWISGKEKLEVLRRARVLVLPSYNESFGNVIVEAISCGTPVVCSEVGGVPDIITDGLHGVLIKPGNSYELLKGIKKLIYDREFWNSCSLEAKIAASEYDEQKIFEVWENIYVQYALIQ